MRACRCSSIDATEHCGSLDTFARVRDECAALKEILIPDWTWLEYRDFCSADPDEACHAPVTCLAFKRRYLARLTEPIHHFCLEGGSPHTSLTKQYRNDLIKRWMFKADAKERFKLAKTFQGRLAELLFAAWLNREGWRIEALEALGGAADVVPTGPAGQPFFFEVKHLGRDEVVFDLGVSALSTGGVSSAWIPIYSPIDYLLFRVFEAGKKLENSPNPKIVVVILADYDVHFAIPLEERWMDWQNPEFFRKEIDIEDFLKRQYASNPNLDRDMKHCIPQIDQIWFYDIGNGLMLRRRRTEQVRRG